MTSIQDATVTTVPRLAAVGVILFLLTPWMLNHLVTFTVLLLFRFSSRIAAYRAESAETNARTCGPSCAWLARVGPGGVARGRVADFSPFSGDRPFLRR